MKRSRSLFLPNSCQPTPFSSTEVFSICSPQSWGRISWLIALYASLKLLETRSHVLWIFVPCKSSTMLTTLQIFNKYCGWSWVTCSNVKVEMTLRCPPQLLEMKPGGYTSKSVQKVWFVISKKTHSVKTLCSTFKILGKRKQKTAVMILKIQRA